MDEETRNDITNTVSHETAEFVWVCLMTSGVAHLHFDERPAPRPAHTLDAEPREVETKRRRIVIAAMQDDGELMIAMEANGCIFLKRGEQHNEFTFIQQGFQIGPAKRLVELLAALAKVNAAVEADVAMRYPQLAHKAP